jgi:predicted nucleic-acid-binding protein
MTVSMRLEESSTSAPLMSTPIDAPRPVPTMIAVGVARPRAHGHATMSTATAATTPSTGSPSTSHHTPKVTAAMATGARREAQRRLGRSHAADADRSGDSPTVSAFVDTNVLVRHLTADPPAMGKRATVFLRKERELFLADLVAAETVYVLEYFYEAPRGEVAQAVRSLIAFESIVCVDPALLLRAIEVYETDRIDFAEAYLVACAESTGIGKVASFDRSIDRVDTIQRIECALSPPPRRSTGVVRVISTILTSSRMKASDQLAATHGQLTCHVVPVASLRWASTASTLRWSSGSGSRASLVNTLCTWDSTVFALT